MIKAAMTKAAKGAPTKGAVAKGAKSATSAKSVKSAKSAMTKGAASKRAPGDPIEQLAPVKADDKGASNVWTERLVLYLRIAAALSILKGLYHWAQVCGFGADPYEGFEAHTIHWQIATVYFAVIDLVAAVGLWLAAPWGVVVWLISAVTTIAVELFLPQVFGGQILTVTAEFALIGGYLYLAVKSAYEHPQ
jgi:hypothetical protein